MAGRPRHVAFLRAINVGGHTVRMAQLRRLFEHLGFSGVGTFIASGNVLFETQVSDRKKLERAIEASLREALGYEVATFVRTEIELAAIAAHEPFPPNDLAEAKTLAVGFLAAPLHAAARRRLIGLRTDIDDFHVRAREIYWLCRERQRDSRFSNMVFEKIVGTRVTFRSITTIRRIAAILRTVTRRSSRQDLGATT